MVGIDPSDIGKHQKLIKAAQEDMATIDVLVCGRCLGVFHFVEEFREHKRFLCDKETQIRDGPDTKPKIWAFLLWKAAQLQNNENNNPSSSLACLNNHQNSWALYQTWVKMDEGIRETWVVAGKTIQSFAKMGHGGLQEMPVKITKTVVDNAATNDRNNITRKIPPTQPKAIATNTKPALLVKKEEDDDVLQTRGTILKKVGAQYQTKSSTTVPPQRLLNRRANRTVPNSNGEVEEEVVEKIVAKRFNPRRKMYEYLVKWEAFSHEQNTWEPQVHLENVPQILENFEKQLAKQKEQRAAQQAKQQAATLAAAVKVVDLKKDTSKDSNKLTDDSNMLSSPGSDSGRLSRTSKSKALDQVKQWCADESNDTVTGSSTGDTSAAANSNSLASITLPSSTVAFSSLKRKLDENDYEDHTMPGDEDLEEDLIPLHTVKRMKNGNTVSVKVETKNDRAVESKIIKVNGNLKASSPGDPFSADVIITEDSGSSGVVKKAGFNCNTKTPKYEGNVRILGKGDPTNSGIIRLSGEAAAAGVTSDNGITIINNQSPTSSTTITSTLLNRTNVNKALASGTPTSIGNIQITQVQTNNNRSSSPKLMNSQTTIARTSTLQQRPTPKSVQTNTRALQTQPRTTSIQRTSMSPGIQQTSPTSGKMIIPRNKPLTVNTQTSNLSRNVTPEQKILQLSKSGDLKVTKKVLPRETPKQPTFSRHQSQVQIQKVQQLTPSGRQIASVKQKHSEVKTAVVDVSAFGEDQASGMYPLSGKLLGQIDGTDLHDDQQHQLASLQSGVLQTQLLTTADQQHGDQAEFHEIDQSGSILLTTGDQQILANDDGTPLLVTGEDGTVYQVAGKNAEGQTILVTQGADGEQQFAYVAAEGDDGNVLTLDNAVAEAVAQLSSEQQAEALAAAAAAESGQFIIKQEDGTSTDLVSIGEANDLNAVQHGQFLQAGGSDSGESQDQNIPAEVVQADLPSPGGTRRVVLMLQDGSFVITQMQDDEFKSLNLAS